MRKLDERIKKKRRKKINLQLKLNKIKNSVAWSHWPHFKNLTATCGYCTGQLGYKTWPSLQKVPLDRAALKAVRKPSRIPELPGGLLKRTGVGRYPRLSDSVGLGQGPRICISNKFPRDCDAAALGTTLWLENF